MLVQQNEILISVILPVYNRYEYLAQAIESVLEQDYPHWELIIADDASDAPTKEFLKRFEQHPKIKIYSSPQNMGLFRNLNQAIRSSSGDYIALLCSDDFLLPHCLSTSLGLLQQQNAKLLLSAFETLHEESHQLTDSSKLHYHHMMQEELKLFDSHSALELLLKYGSINGNLTGMFFTQDLPETVGEFREDSYQTADWEWVYQVARCHPILLSKTPIAVVRNHKKQLSGVNFGNLRNSLEVAETVQKLLNDPYLRELPDSMRWAQYIMHHHLWYGLKLALKGDVPKSLTLARAIHQATGLWGTFSALLRNFPRRWNAHWNKTYMLPPH